VVSPDAAVFIALIAGLGNDGRCGARGSSIVSPQPFRERRDRVSLPYYEEGHPVTQTIVSPIPGIFYRRPGPDQPLFKSEGDMVAVGDTVGLIEVMKTFTPVVAEVSGRVVRFLAENEDAIMAGQPLVELDG
jgi:biotin carboxyl carrier protein